MSGEKAVTSGEAAFLQITGNTATVGGKNVVRTVNDVAADATGNVVVQDVFIDGTDSAANRGQIGNARNVVNLDYNDYKKTGTWRVEGSLQKNSPADLQIAGILTVVADRTQNYVVQTFMRTHLGDTMYTRTFHGTDGWHPWRRVMLDVQDENCVHKTGVETIAGSKTFTDRLYLDGDVIRRIGGTSGRIALQNTNLVKGTNPTTTIWFDLPCVDGLDANTVNRAGAWSTCVLSDGSTKTYMRAYKWQSESATSADIYVGITQDGKAYTYAPTPNADSSDNNIATTQFVSQWLAKFLRLTGGTLSGDVFVENTAQSSSVTRNLGFISTDFEKGGDVSSGKSARFYFYDKNGLGKSVNAIGGVNVGFSSEGDFFSQLIAFKNAAGSSTSARIEIRYDKSTDSFVTYAPTPVSSSNDDSIPTTRWVRANTVPPGTILPFAGTTVPTGFLLCNGALVSRTTYATLFAAIGTKWGAGDGKTTFKLPDLRKRHLQGANATSDVGGYLAAGLPNIRGGVTGYEFSGGGFTCGGAFFDDTSSNHYQLSRPAGNTGSSGLSSILGFDASRLSAIFSDEEISVQPPSAKALFIVKT